MKTRILLIIFGLLLSFSVSIAEEKWELIDHFDNKTKREFNLDTLYSIWAKEIFCHDSNNYVVFGSIAGSQPYVRKTTDAGKTWHLMLYDTRIFDPSVKQNDYSNRPRVAACPSKDLCIIGNDSGYYWRSTNGLKDWKKYRIKGAASFNQLKFIDTLYGVAISNNKIYITSDGGFNWNNVDFVLPDSIKKYDPAIITLIDKDTCILLASSYDEKKGYLVSTYDQFKTFQVTSSSFTLYSDYQFLPRHFRNSKHGFASPKKMINLDYYINYILETTDGGKTWVERLKIDPGFLTFASRYEFIDDVNGYAFAWYWKLWKTADGGKTWQEDTSCNSKNIKWDFVDVAYVDKNTIIGVTSEEGMVYRQVISPSTTVINNIASNKDFLIFPNPLSTGQELSLQFSLAEAGEVTIELSDMLGRKCSADYKHWFEPGSRTLRYSPDKELSSGLYFLTLKSAAGAVTKRLIVTK